MTLDMIVLANTGTCIPSVWPSYSAQQRDQGVSSGRLRIVISFSSLSSSLFLLLLRTSPHSAPSKTLSDIPA